MKPCCSIRGAPVHVVAARCGHDPAVLLRSYAERTKKSATSAANVWNDDEGAIVGVGSKLGPSWVPLQMRSPLRSLPSTR